MYLTDTNNNNYKYEHAMHSHNISNNISHNIQLPPNLLNRGLDTHFAHFAHKPYDKTSMCWQHKHQTTTKTIAIQINKQSTCKQTNKQYWIGLIKQYINMQNKDIENRYTMYLTDTNNNKYKYQHAMHSHNLSHNLSHNIKLYLTLPS